LRPLGSQEATLPISVAPETRTTGAKIVTDVLLVDRTDGVATLTFNRPASLNSLSVELKQALVDALPDIAADAAVDRVSHRLEELGRRIGKRVVREGAEDDELRQQVGFSSTVAPRFLT
jgi:1,4-dihydroxy-2-naphthoyl-CoA synthase